MNIRINHIEKTDDNEAFVVVDVKELSKLGIKKEVLLDPEQHENNIECFVDELCWFADTVLFNGSANSIICEITEEDENSIRFTFTESEENDDLDFIDDENQDYYDCSRSIRSYETTGPIGIIRVDSFENCMKTISFLRCYNNRCYEIYTIKDKFFINVKGYGFPKERLVEYCAGAVSFYSEHYVDMIRAHVIEHKGKVFCY